MFMNTINRDIVGAFIFSKDGKVLLGKNKSGGTYKGLWTVPGGGVENGESVHDALKREMLEEIGLDISSANLEPLDLKYGESPKTINSEIFLVKMTFHDYKVRMSQSSVDIALTDGDDFEQATWIDISELKNLGIAPPTAMTLHSFNLI